MKLQAGASISHGLPRTLGWLLSVTSAMTMAASDGLEARKPTHPNQIQQVVEVCSQEMQKSICRTSNDKSPPPASGSVFVAGSGQIDAGAYQSLRDAGDAMCEQARQSCEDDWTGSACRTARSLWASQ